MATLFDVVLVGGGLALAVFPDFWVNLVRASDSVLPFRHDPRVQRVSTRAWGILYTVAGAVDLAFIVAGQESLLTRVLGGS